MNLFWCSWNWKVQIHIHRDFSPWIWSKNNAYQSSQSSESPKHLEFWWIWPVLFELMPHLTAGPGALLKCHAWCWWTTLEVWDSNRKSFTIWNNDYFVIIINCIKYGTTTHPFVKVLMNHDGVWDFNKNFYNLEQLCLKGIPEMES